MTLLDLRSGSDYGRVVSTELSTDKPHLLFIPKGVAHGFSALTDGAVMLYKTNTVHEPEADYGIRWDSFGFNWEIKEPIMSTRDQQHVEFADFVTPF